ncbi:aminotransferase class I/II-fold pyridoxal phosphate-dependent enzyme [Desulfosediminicola ganghwensis]|uniref:aminotransferase class I/II-fold pyridoxal phosphate-dependent enzyme n=1 Tax=Desulfosediminicola ganghwensis TaxID=2569540 RepID=UPI0010AC5797|nr:8-amino-7-oxononanoate synthase [Desulfosediminicola ganghwensis]
MDLGYSDILDGLRASGRFRQLKPLSGRDGCRLNVTADRALLNLSSNDYLGIAGNREHVEFFYSGLNRENSLESFRLGSTSSRLLSGDCEQMHLLEKELAEAYGFEAALFFNSGYHANIGILPALLGKHDLILTDKLNHASIHDGIRLCRATYKRYRHCDYAHLEKLIQQHRDTYQRVVIITESVFSMDGDVADLSELVRIKEKYDCLLYLDEAHAVGVWGQTGLGKAQEFGVLDKIDLLVGPFGKACASMGAFVLSNAEIHDYLVNTSRSLIFTTALPPVIASWNLYVFRLIQQMGNERKHLIELSVQLRESLLEYGLRTAGSTNIVPVVIGENKATVSAANSLQEDGYLIFPVRPPTVPEGTARFRLSLTADMQWTDLAPLAARIAKAVGPLHRAGAER